MATDEKRGAVFLTPEQLAERWGVSVSTLATWRSPSRAVGLAFVKVSGRRVLYRLSDVEEFERRRTRRG
jgi:hypothetical protein